MKKLLSILAAVGLTATASTAVVACGSSSPSATDDLTSTILKNSSLGEIDASQILQDIQDHGQESLIFGDKGTALKTFMNYAAESFMKNSDKLKTQVEAHAKVKPDDASYVDDGVWDSINKDWSTKQSNATDAWNQAQKDAQSKYGKQWEDSWLSDLKNQFGNYIYDASGNKVVASSYNDYKNLYISYSILNGTTNGKSIADSLKDDIYSWTNGPTGDTIANTLSTISSQLFNVSSDIKVGGQTVNFVKNNKTSTGVPTSDARKTTWFGQMDNLINGIESSYATAKTAADAAAKADHDADKKDADGTTVPDTATADQIIAKMSSDDQTYFNYLINLINMTGGYGTAKDLAPIADAKNFVIDQMHWANKENLISTLDSSNTVDYSNNLIQRLDDKYDQDFINGANKSGTTDTKNLVINGDYDVSGKIGTLYSEDGKTTTSQINGMLSNSQRYVANDYYNIEKPVAVSELVVKPLYTQGSDLSQFISNQKFVGSDATLMKNLYKFYGNFINNTVGGTGANTANHAADKKDTNNTSAHYSWDDLMEQGGLKNVKAKDGSSFDSTFAGDVSFTAHSNLLTRDSASSDYSDLLKYSVYDYLNKVTQGADKFKEYVPKSDSLELKDNGVQLPIDMSQSDVEKGNAPTSVDPAYFTITNLVDSLNRSTKKDESAKAIYKVVNKEQGIISFIDNSGIHFVRIEGFGTLAGNAANGAGTVDTSAAKFVKKQQALSTNDFSSSTQNDLDAVQTAYHSSQLLSTQLNGSNASDAQAVTYDYTNENTSAQHNVGASYKDLNSGLGNDYLQFLANSSIAKSNGASNAKYSYNLNSELQSFTSADITADNLGDSSDMLSFIWDYIATITGWTDEQLFEFVANDGTVTTADNPQPKGMLFDVLRNADVSADTKKTFTDLYKEYIMGAIGSNNDSTRATKGNENFRDNWKKADKTLKTGTTWTNTDDVTMDFHPSLTFKEAYDTSASSGGDTKLDAQTKGYYQTQADYLKTNGIWKPFSSFVESGQGQDTHIKNNYTRNVAIQYNVHLSSFVPNKYAVKGDAE